MTFCVHFLFLKDGGMVMRKLCGRQGERHNHSRDSTDAILKAHRKLIGHEDCTLVGKWTFPPQQKMEVR